MDLKSRQEAVLEVGTLVASLGQGLILWTELKWSPRPWAGWWERRQVSQTPVRNLGVPRTLTKTEKVWFSYRMPQVQCLSRFAPEGAHKSGLSCRKFKEYFAST